MLELHPESRVVGGLFVIDWRSWNAIFRDVNVLTSAIHITDVDTEALKPNDELSPELSPIG